MTEVVSRWLTMLSSISSPLSTELPELIIMRCIRNLRRVVQQIYHLVHRSAMSGSHGLRRWSRRGLPIFTLAISYPLKQTGKATDSPHSPIAKTPAPHTPETLVGSWRLRSRSQRSGRKSVCRTEPFSRAQGR